MDDQDLQRLVTNDPISADVHVIRMGDLNIEVRLKACNLLVSSS